MYNLFVILFAKVLNFFANILCKILHKDNGNMLGKIVKKTKPRYFKKYKNRLPSNCSNCYKWKDNNKQCYSIYVRAKWQKGSK